MTNSIQVKICGLTNLEDAIVAIEAGADYLGFIFYPPSKRSISVETAIEVVAALRQRDDCPILVGVFVNESAEWMAELLERCNLDLAQLNGEEVPFIINDRRSILYGRAYKALRPQSLGEAEAEAEWFIAEAPDLMPSILLDAYHPELPGGTGELSDWEVGRHIVNLTPGLMLAGGLKPHNVAQAIRDVRPFAVDVASGVEAYPGKKDHEAVRSFITAAQTALDE